MSHVCMRWSNQNSSHTYATCRKYMYQFKLRIALLYMFVRLRARVCVCCRVLALLFSFVVFLFFRQMYICYNIIIHLCLLMANSMFSADFANKLWTIIITFIIINFIIVSFPPEFVSRITLSSAQDSMWVISRFGSLFSPNCLIKGYKLYSESYDLYR